MYVSTDETDRICVTAEFSEYTDESYFEFDFPDDFDFNKQNEYRIEDGKLIHDPLPPTEEEIAAQQELQRQAQMQTATTLFVRTSAATLSDEEALSVSLLFEEWEDLDHFLKDRIYRYKDDIYRCLREHDKQESWTPDQAHSIFVRVRPEGEILEWEPIQPGVNEPYKKGDKVKHNGKIWESDIDNNVWEPGVYGWTEVK